MILKTVPLALAALSLASCSAVGPDFMRPSIKLENSYAFVPQTALRQAANDEWWQALRDPILNDIMRRGLAQNLTLEAAVERIREAQATLGTTGFAEGVSGDLVLSGQRVHANGVNSDSRQLRIGPSFVLDLFGGQRRSREAAAANVNAAIYDSASAKLALQLSLVTTYLDLRYHQTVEQLRRRSISNQSRVVSVMRDRFAAQEETKVALRRAEATLEIERSSLPEARANIETTTLALATLLAEPGQKLLAELADRPAGLPRPATGIAPGVPASLLQNRPDIRAAEARLASAVAQIGVLEAQLYPSLTLSGTVSVGTTDSVIIGPSLSLPLFDRQVRVGRRNAAVSRAIQADISWRQTVLEGVEEVQTNLSLLRSADRQLSSLSRARNVSREAARLSEDAFELGAVTSLDIIDAQEDLRTTELRLANAHRLYARSWATLNVAIGQGWHVGAENNLPASRFKANLGIDESDLQN